MIDVPEAARPLLELKPRHSFFVGIDSDGCVFDSMEIKHKECFCPNIVRFWDLQPVSKFAREAVEFINLYSKWRGVNRWPALLLALDLLRDRPEVLARRARVPELEHLKGFVDSGLPHSNDGLKLFMQESGHPELKKGLEWSEAVNAAITEIVHGLPPFPFVRESLERMQAQADMVIVSGTPSEALQREWAEHEIDTYVRVIAGQEMGKKSLHLRLATEGKYEREKVLMIGDSPGDLKAAKANGVLFFPVNPGSEDRSWERFYKEAYGRFREGSYAGGYEAELIVEFEALLPEVPPWKQ
jgi:phosphoglycolate phosphatase-like HAD superfamily hydrolase